jgi:DMSO/TMAO reductase YedYZ molybdopterin-dependent catalytic subunit
VTVGWVAATPLTLRHPRLVQRVGTALIGPLQRLFEHVDAIPGQYAEKDISPYFWHNGRYPESVEYATLLAGDFAGYRLRVNGLVKHPIELDLAQLRALAHHEQITQHFCIQGWSGIAKWGGVSLQTLTDLVEPLPFGHGAPLRLRNEVQLGFKQVKWVKGVEFVAHYAEIGSGHGGYSQDHEFFGYRQSI